MRSSKLVVLTMFVVACSQGNQGESAPTAPTGTAPAGTAATPSPATPPPTAAEQSAYVLYSATMQKQANNDKKVKNPTTGKDESNWIATLYRGEQISLLKVEGEWSHIRSSDGKEGYIKAAALLAGEGVTVATVLDETKTFVRPTFMAPGKAVIPVGSLVFVTKESPDKAFSEVNFTGTNSVWVESGKLATDSKEISAAALVSRARYLEERKDPQAAQYWDLAKTQFGDAQVVQKATAPAGGVPGAAEPAPAAAPAPSGDAPAAPSDDN